MGGRRMKQARKRRGWSQQKAAAALGVSQSYLSMLETGERELPRGLARKVVAVYGLTPTWLPLAGERWAPKKVPPQELAKELATLGYPGFAYLRKRAARKNPAEILLTALAQGDLEARVFEALPWLLVKFWGMDLNWLAEQARLRDLQNRLGFVVTLARAAAQERACANPRRDKALERLESGLKGSLLAREEVLNGTKLTGGERAWLKKHRSKEAREWNLLTNWRAEALRHVA